MPLPYKLTRVLLELTKIQPSIRTDVGLTASLLSERLAYSCRTDGSEEEKSFFLSRNLQTQEVKSAILKPKSEILELSQSTCSCLHFFG